MKHYEERVYAGVLGKVIGVYMGRPFEGWHKTKLEAKWGTVSGYVNEDVNKALVVADDDISGTLTFIRALEDSGLYKDTPEAFFGDTWLNYIVENKTILWWGGLGCSTEHTAFLRLKEGVQSPASGSSALNGRTVAEQIGAQIFIDAFGMVAPGRPELAAELARKSARVSHDGEAVEAAVVVAGMVSAAFVEPRMSRLLDIGLNLIPKACLTAQVHRDVRAWCRQDGDWRKTFDRIERKYGYQTYGGNCHVIPNHALMVMAWCYAPEDFYESQRIINTAGWDTDCNAANVGAVMGVKVGLSGINARYNFQGPFADRILLPTAEGTRSTTDCLVEALRIARIGRKVMGWQALAAPKGGAWHHFEMPRALHGYMAETQPALCRGTATVANVAAPSRSGKRGMRIRFEVDAVRVARVSTPVLARPVDGGYNVMSTPRLYSGMTVKLSAAAGATSGRAKARLFVRYLTGEQFAEAAVVYGAPVDVRAGKAFSLSLTVPDTKGRAVLDLGIEIAATEAAVGDVVVDRVEFSGRPQVKFLDTLSLHGWISSADHTRGGFSDDRGAITYGGKNKERGVLVTGTTDWRDYTFEARVKIHLAEKGGILVRYQGLERYLALVWSRGDKLQLIERYYGDTVLGEAPCKWTLDELHALKVVCRGRKVTAYCDGRKVLEGTDLRLGCGGAGLLFEKGLVGFNRIQVR